MNIKYDGQIRVIISVCRVMQTRLPGIQNFNRQMLYAYCRTPAGFRFDVFSLNVIHKVLKIKIITKIKSLAVN
jgi:hypothetical protein